MNLKRNIKLYLIGHSTPIIFYIGITIIVILGMRGLQYIIQEQEDGSNEIILPQQEEIKTNKEYARNLEKFITLCKEKNIEEAFDMLASECKTELYPTLDIFQSEFVDKNFKMKEDTQIRNTDDDSTIYTIEILEDALTSGKLEGRAIKKIIYCKLIEKNKEIKIYINYNN